MSSSGSQWQQSRLGDFVDIIHGWPFKSSEMTDERGGHPVVVSVGNFDYDGGFRFDSTRVREYLGEYPPEYELAPDDLLLVMTCQTSGGEILGVPGRVPNDGLTYLHNQRLGKAVIRDPEAIDPEYLYWLCTWRDFNHHLFATATGSKILHTAPTRIENFEWHRPPLKEQREIASILSSLDDKIELNRRMCGTLESLARAVFRSWFVDFEPVRANAEAAGHPNPLGPPSPGYRPLPEDLLKLFPDGFQDSAQGPIPIGWSYEKLDSEAEVAIGKTPPRKEQHWFTKPPEGVKWASIRDLGESGLFITNTSESLTEAALGTCRVRTVETGTVLLSFKLTVGRLAIADERMATNEAIAHLPLRPGARLTREFLVEYLRQFDYGNLGSTSSIATAVNSKTIRQLPVLVPGDLAPEFSAIVGPVYERIRSLQMQNEQLTQIRDTLLPKLMSGELQTFNRET